MSWNRESLRYARKRRYGESMVIGVGIGTGILCYLLNMMCRYDGEMEKEYGRGRYLWVMDRNRALILVLCMAGCVGMTWIFSQYYYGPLKSIRYLLLLAMLWPIARKDAKEKIIPNRWLFYILACRMVLFVAEIVCFPDLWLENVAFTFFGGVISGAVFLVAYVISRHAVGMGDVKLFAVIGLCLGFRTTYLVMVMSLILSAFYGVGMVLRKKKSMKDEIAFGPFIAAGTFIILFIGA